MIETILTCDRCKKVVEKLDKWGISIADQYHGAQTIWSIEICGVCQADLRMYTNPEVDPITRKKPERDIVGALETLREWIDDTLSETP